jgi:bile acid-coenzyme A ligase
MSVATETPTDSVRIQVRTWVGLAALLIIFFAYNVLEVWISPALPVIQRQLHASNASIALVFTAMLVCAAVSTTLAGRLGDVYGLRPVLLAVLAILSAGIALAATATSIQVLAVGQAMQGIGLGSAPLSVAILRRMFPPSRVTVAIGVFVGTSAIGSVLGFVLPGYVLDVLSYRWLFLLPFIAIVVSTLAAWMCLPTTPKGERRRVDWFGAVGLTLGLTVLLLAVLLSPIWGWFSGRTLALYGVALVLLWAWVVLEARSREPLIAVDLLRQRSVWVTGLISITIGFGIFAGMTLVPILAARPHVNGIGFGANTTQVGMLLLPLGVAGVLIGPLTGYLDRRIGSRAIVRLGMLTLTVGLFSLVFLHTQKWHIVLAVSLSGIGIYLALIALINLITYSVADKDVGFAAGLPLTAKSIGGALGAQICASVLASKTSHSTGAPLELGFTISFAIAAIVALGGLMLSLALPSARKVRRRRTQMAAANESPTRWPDGQTPLGVTLAGLAERLPDRPAITHDGVTRTYRELEERTNRLARAYGELGVGQDSFVTIGLPNGIEFFEAVLATYKLGATPQPISWRLPAAERSAIIELASPALLVGVEAGEASCPAVPAAFEPDPALSCQPLPPKVASSWKAVTSGGSTGRPKLIVSTTPAVFEGIAFLATLFQMRQGGVQVVAGPLYHNAPFLTGMVGLLTGNHQVVMTRFDAETCLALIQQHRVDWVHMVPTMMHRIWRLPEDVRCAYDLTSLRIVFHGAAPCPVWLKEAWIDWLGPDRVWELYSATEGQAGTAITGKEWLDHKGSVGRIAAGQICILDPDGAELPSGEVGAIWMRRGENAPPEYRYIGAEARSRDGGWESHGDLGYFDSDGYLYLTDRETDMILVGGANVYPAEVESALEQHPLVVSSCVVGIPDEDLGNVLHAIVQVDGPVSDELLLMHLRERLVTYKLPRTFERVTEPLRGDDGKVRRSALRSARLSAASTTDGSALSAPNNT